MKDLHIRAYIWFQNQVERTERNESNVEHGTNELILEWPHLVEQLPHLVAVVLPGGAS